MNLHDRMMAKRDDILLHLGLWLPSPGASAEAYDAKLDLMYERLSEMLRLTVDEVKLIDATCVGHSDYAAKFALRLSFKYFGYD